MATPGERKALLFFALVATLGAGVRLWRARHADTPGMTSAMQDDGFGDQAHGPPGASRSRKGTGKRPRQGKGGMPAGRASGSASSGRSRTTPITRDLSSTVDLDRASQADIEALGVLQPGVARLIVADRDSFGPFGSIQELERVPFLSTAVLRKLAPRVTFSRIPRPRNTVIQSRSRDAGAVGVAGAVVPRRARRRKVPVQ